MSRFDSDLDYLSWLNEYNERGQRTPSLFCGHCGLDLGEGGVTCQQCHRPMCRACAERQRQLARQSA